MPCLFPSLADQGGQLVKYKRTPPPDKLTPEEQAAIVAWCRESYPKLRPKLRELWEDCKDFYLMRGEEGDQINWPATFRRWIRRADMGPPKRWAEPYPQEPRTHKKADLRLVRDIFKKDQDGNNKA